MTQPKPLISPQNAANKLKEIRAWKLQPWTPHSPLKSAALDQTRRGTTGPRLPFPIDTVTTDGAQGIDTPNGVDALQELWAAWLSWLLNIGIKGDPGAWLLKQLEENRDLIGINIPPAEPAEQDTPFTEWAKFARELNTCWWKVAHATGNAPTNHGTCTNCGQGQWQTTPTNQGHTDQATCTHCQHQINTTNEEETNAAFRAILRQPDRQDWITLTAAHAIWPNLRKATIIKWAQRGHIRKNAGLYHLGDINQRQTTKDTQ